MPEACRQTDPFTCGDTMCGGSGDVFINNLKATRIGVDLTCGHCFEPIAVDTGSPDVYVNNIPLARVGDPHPGHSCSGATHGGQVASGSPDVFVNDGSDDVVVDETFNTGRPDPTVYMTAAQDASLAAQQAAGPARFSGIPADEYLEIADEYPDDPAQVKNIPICLGLDALVNPYQVAQIALTKDYRERKGPSTNPNIVALWHELGFTWQKGDDTHWCAIFVGATLKRSGNEYIQTAASRDYATYADPVPGATINDQLNNAQPGDVCVFSRNDPSNPRAGHVAFFSSYGGGAKVSVLGGNQSNNVKISSYSVAKLLTIRRPEACS